MEQAIRKLNVACQSEEDGEGTPLTRPASSTDFQHSQIAIASPPANRRATVNATPWRLCRLNGCRAFQQVRWVGLRLAPSVNVNDDGTQILQRRDQVGEQSTNACRVGKTRRASASGIGQRW